MLAERISPQYVGYTLHSPYLAAAVQALSKTADVLKSIDLPTRSRILKEGA